MIDLPTQELATMGVLNLLSAEEQVAFDHALENEEFRALVRQLQETTADLAGLLPPVVPSPRVKTALMKSIQAKTPQARNRITSYLPWALAACLAVSSAFLWVESRGSRAALVSFKNEAALAKLELRLLKATPDAPADAVAMVAWDEVRQVGVIELQKMPGLKADHDYQLWVVDPAQSLPINAGIVRGGLQKTEFRPDVRIQHATNFVITLERAGGVPKAEGPAVLVGEKI